MKSDRDQLQELMANYANAIDSKDYDGVMNCFAPEGTATFAGFSNSLKGNRAVRDHMSASLELLDATQHLFSNFIIDVDGDHARLSAGIMAQQVRRGAPGGDTYMAGNTYKVEARRVTGEWKIRSATLGPVLWGDGNRNILPHAS